MVCVIFYTHQTGGMCAADACMCDLTHQIGKTGYMSYEFYLLHYFLSSDSTSFNKKRKKHFRQKETKLVLY